MNNLMPSAFEPLLPLTNLSKLLALAASIIDLASSFDHALHPLTKQSLAALLREMNSYYSNKIEGHNTHPMNIVRALNENFSDKPKIAKLQRLALAHIGAEIEIEEWTNNPHFSPYTQESIRQIHRALYSRLSENDRIIEKGLIVEPGAWRERDVSVGHHIPPNHQSIAAFLLRYEKFYTTSTTRDQQLLMIASAHHRLAWIHPFIDGNGRVARLTTHAALYKHFTGGLWSICRGLARTQEEYYARLAEADAARQGDLDGRGNLSDKGLAHFCLYFLTVCLDQLTFMKKMLNLDEMKIRIDALITYRSLHDKNIRREAVLPLHYLFIAGQLTRAEFKQMTGLGDKVAQTLTSHLLKIGLLVSDTPLGAVRFGLPLDALAFYFPNLYPEANTLNEDVP